MSEATDFSRREFLASAALAGGGLVLGFHVPAFGQTPASSRSAGATFAPNAFVRIGADNSVTVVVNHSEMGQGVYTGLPMLLAEELDADWSKVRVEAAPVDAAYNHAVYGIQMTGGSSSTWSEWDRFRKAGATARALLVAAAAQEWKLNDASGCRTENGYVIESATGRRVSYGALADKAAGMAPPVDVRMKDPKDYKLIGKPIKRTDTPAKTNGSAVFGLDVSVPGMLVAVVARSPVFGGTLRSFDGSKAKAVRGVKDVVRIDRGVAVVAEGFWTAKKARELVTVDWDLGPLAHLDSGELRKQYAALATRPGVVAKNAGDASGVLGRAEKKLEAVYELPYLAHATMEPQNCVADVREDRCEIWTGTQFQTVDRAAAAKAVGLSPEQVKIHTTLLGGGFGRRAVPDSHMVVEAVQISKAVKAPVKVVWTREDDTRGGYYRPAAYHAMSGCLGTDGKPAAWQHDIVCQSFIVGTPFEAVIIRNGVDETAVEGASDVPYDIPDVHVEWHPAPGGVPCLWWRSVGHSHTAFVVESFLDELAHAAGKDPFEYRRGLLGKHARYRGALELAAEKAGWSKPTKPGVGRGIAVHESFGSFVAQVAEVSVDARGEVRVHRVVCAVDCGPCVNPDQVHAQMESGVVFGLTAALYGQITFADGRVTQGNFHDYPMVRINEMPLVEAHIVPSREKMGGIGETGVPPIAAAVCNAIFACTGKRIRRLPIDVNELKRA